MKTITGVYRFYIKASQAVICWKRHKKVMVYSKPFNLLTQWNEVCSRGFVMNTLANNLHIKIPAVDNCIKEAIVQAINYLAWGPLRHA
jgi:hypothetical protein